MESELWPLLEVLDDEIEGLSTSLAPLLKNTLPENTAKLPLVDQAKLYVLTTYAIESLLFSYIDLNGNKAKDHPIMTELNRVKQYFNKIREAETKPTKRENLALNKEAANRFIKHALSGNDKYDKERAEQIARERARAHIKFNELGEPIKSSETPESRNSPSNVEEVEDDDDDLLDIYDEKTGDQTEKPEEQSSRADASSGPATPSEQIQKKKRSKKEKKRKREGDAAQNLESSGDTAAGKKSKQK